MPTRTTTDGKFSYEVSMVMGVPGSKISPPRSNGVIPILSVSILTGRQYIADVMHAVHATLYGDGVVYFADAVRDIRGVAYPGGLNWAPKLPIDADQLAVRTMAAYDGQRYTDADLYTTPGYLTV